MIQYSILYMNVAINHYRLYHHPPFLSILYFFFPLHIAEVVHDPLFVSDGKHPAAGRMVP